MLRRGAATWDPCWGIYKVVIPLLALQDKVGQVVIPLRCQVVLSSIQPYNTRREKKWPGILRHRAIVLPFADAVLDHATDPDREHCPDD